MRIGVDLGGTKIEIAALDEAGSIVVRERVASPAGDYAGTIRAIAELVIGVERRTGGAASVGIGMPGAISPATGLVKNANSTWLNGTPLQQDLCAALNREVRVANDANCFALSEAVDGAAAGAAVVFGVILGTGVGGGIVIGQRVIAGHQAIAGEWGHNPLPWMRDDERAGAACYCGKRGCIETFLSGPGLTRDYGDGIAAPGVVSRAADGEPKARAALERYCDRLARALATVVNVLDPDVIVLGGGMSNVELLYGAVPQRLGAYVFSDSCTTPVVKNRHGDSSGVRGAAWLWPAR